MHTNTSRQTHNLDLGLRETRLFCHRNRKPLRKQHAPGAVSPNHMFNSPPKPLTRRSLYTSVSPNRPFVKPSLAIASVPGLQPSALTRSVSLIKVLWNTAHGSGLYFITLSRSLALSLSLRGPAEDELVPASCHHLDWWPLSTSDGSAARPWKTGEGAHRQNRMRNGMKRNKS